MDANPTVSLLLLYRNDPIYSLCAPDLMSASQKVNNDFIRDQKQLVKTLKRLEQQKLARLRQLNEEKKQFAFIMRKRLPPRGAGPSAPPLLGLSCCAASKISIPTGLFVGTSSHQASATTIGSMTLSLCSSRPVDLSTRFQERREGPKVCAAPTRCPCERGRASKWVTRSESFLPAMQHRTAWAGTSQHFSGRVGGVKKPGKN